MTTEKHEKLSADYIENFVRVQDETKFSQVDDNRGKWPGAQAIVNYIRELEEQVKQPKSVFVITHEHRHGVDVFILDQEIELPDLSEGDNEEDQDESKYENTLFEKVTGNTIDGDYNEYCTSEWRNVINVSSVLAATSIETQEISPVVAADG